MPTNMHSSLIKLLVRMKLLLLLSVVAYARCTHNFDAVVDMVPGVDKISGRLYLQNYQGGVLISGRIQGLSQGLHGFHVHEKGDLSEQCTAAGGHFNPFKTNHGAPTDYVRHVGDLGNIQANYNGEADVYIHDRQISLDPHSQRYIGNLAVVVHQGTDDLGRGGNEDSLKTGNAGKRSGCGIITIPYATPVQRYRPSPFLGYQSAPNFKRRF